MSNGKYKYGGHVGSRLIFAVENEIFVGRVDRRQILGALGGSFVLGAGYVQTVPDVAREPFRFDPAVDEPFGTVEVGRRENVANPEKYGSHTLSIWNKARERRLQVRIRGVVRGNEWRIARTYPTYQYLEVELLEPDEYHIAVGPEPEPTSTVPVDGSWFDCNVSGTIIRVDQVGNLQYSSGGTLALCDSWSASETQ